MRLIAANDAARRAVAPIVVGLALAAGPSQAEDFTAGVVLREMDDQRLGAFLTGVVEGLAYARYQKDERQPEGMQCIYNWFYAGEDTMIKIYAAFAENSDAAPASVVAYLVEGECGK